MIAGPDPDNRGINIGAYTSTWMDKLAEALYPSAIDRAVCDYLMGKVPDKQVMQEVNDRRIGVAERELMEAAAKLRRRLYLRELLLVADEGEET